MAEPSQLERLRALQEREEALLSGMQDERAMMSADEKRRLMGDLDEAQILGTDFEGEDDNRAFGTPLRPQAAYPSREELDRGARSLDGLRGVSSNEFEYKPEFQARGAPSGKREGPMAHELRPLGVTAFDDDGMERVDVPHLAMKNASATGELAREKADRDELEELRDRIDALSVGVGGDDPDETLRAARSGRF